MDVHDISYKVVVKFLDDPDLIYNDDYYDILLDIILSGEIEYAPNEIVNWIIAYNNLNNKNIKIIKLSDILLDKIDLDELYDIFEVDTKDDIIQILFYLHKLNNDLTIFNNLPDEILRYILLNLDLDSLLLWFKTNKSTNLYGKNQLNDILKSKITLYSDYDIENLNIEQLMILVKIIEKGRYYGKIIGDKLMIYDREYNLEKILKLYDKRLLHEGRICDTFKYHELLEILWSIKGRLAYNSITLTENDRENIIAQLLAKERMHMADGKFMFQGNLIVDKKYYNYYDMKNWDLQKLIFFYNWIRSRTPKSVICENIKNRMEELNIIKYL
jgi:hypothetical protein